MYSGNLNHVDTARDDDARCIVVDACAQNVSEVQ